MTILLIVCVFDDGQDGDYQEDSNAATTNKTQYLSHMTLCPTFLFFRFFVFFEILRCF